MMMELIGEVIHRSPVTEMDMLHHPDLLQCVQSAVHGGQMDVRKLPMDLGRQLFGGDVAVGAQQRGDDGPTGLGDAPRTQAYIGNDGVIAGRVDALETRLPDDLGLILPLTWRLA